MWSEQFSKMLALVVTASLLRTFYELSRQRNSVVEQVVGSNPSAASNPSGEIELTPWQKDASAKAVKQYAEAQGKKWRRWNEAMFEREG
jgi:hypothetical protein